MPPNIPAEIIRSFHATPPPIPKLRVDDKAAQVLRPAFGEEVTDRVLDKNDPLFSSLGGQAARVAGVRLANRTGTVGRVEAEMLVAQAIALGKAPPSSLSGEARARAAKRYEELARSTKDPERSHQQLLIAARLYVRLGDTQSLERVGKEILKLSTGRRSSFMARRSAVSYKELRQAGLSKREAMQLMALVADSPRARSGLATKCARWAKLFKQNGLDPMPVLRGLLASYPREEVLDILTQLEEPPLTPEQFAGTLEMLATIRRHEKLGKLPLSKGQIELARLLYLSGVADPKQIEAILDRIAAPPGATNTVALDLAVTLYAKRTAEEEPSDPIATFEHCLGLAKQVVLEARLTSADPDGRTVDALADFVLACEEKELPQSIRALRVLGGDQFVSALFVAHHQMTVGGQAAAQAVRSTTELAVGANRKVTRSQRLDAAARLLRAGIPASELPMMLDFACSKGAGEMKARLATARAVMSLFERRKVTNPHKRLAILRFVHAYGQPDPSRFVRVIDTLDIDTTDLTYQRFPVAFAEQLNAHVEKNGLHERSATAIIELINSMHDADLRANGKDAMRMSFAQNLPSESAYRLIAFGEDSLYTSSYELIAAQLGALVPAAELPDFLQRVDPKGVHWLSFVNTLCRFGDTDLLVERRDFFLPLITKELAKGENPMQTLSRVLPFFEAIAEDLAPEEVARLEMNALAKLNDPKATLEQKAAAALLLRFLYEHNASLSYEARKVAEGLPALPDVRPPVDQWLTDGKITMKIFTYPSSDEPPAPNWLIDKASYFLHSDDLEPKFTIDRAASPHPDKQIVLTRTYKGVEQRIIISGDPNDSRELAFNDPSIDIVAHRGHSTRFKNTFSSDITITSDHPQLRIGGSCGSMGEMTDEQFVATFGRGLLLADSGTGVAKINNRITVSLLNGTAERKTDWSEYHRLDEFANKHGIRLPSDNVFLGGHYLELYRKHVDAPAVKTNAEAALEQLIAELGEAA